MDSKDAHFEGHGLESSHVLVDLHIEVPWEEGLVGSNPGSLQEGSHLPFPHEPGVVDVMGILDSKIVGLGQNDSHLSEARTECRISS